MLESSQKSPPEEGGSGHGGMKNGTQVCCSSHAPHEAGELEPVVGTGWLWGAAAGGPMLSAARAKIPIALFSWHPLCSRPRAAPAPATAATPAAGRAAGWLLFPRLVLESLDHSTVCNTLPNSPFGIQTAPYSWVNDRPADGSPG